MGSKLVDLMLAAGPTKRLEACGFRRRRRRFTRTVGCVRQAIWPEVGKWSLPDIVMFRLEGACTLDYLEELMEQAGLREPNLEDMPFASAQWPGAEDADDILSKRMDPFWTVTSPTDAAHVGNQLARYLTQRVVPWFERHRTDEACLETHFEQWTANLPVDAWRLSFRAVVMAHTGNHDAARTAIQEAEALARAEPEASEAARLVRAAAARVCAEAG